MNLTDLVAIGTFVVLICTIVGGWLVVRSTIAKSAMEISAHVREELAAENQILKDRIERLEKENSSLRQIINTIRHALKRRGLHIDIEGEFVTLIDAAGQADSTRFSSTAKPNLAKVVRPVKLTPFTDDNDTIA